MGKEYKRNSGRSVQLAGSRTGLSIAYFAGGAAAVCAILSFLPHDSAYYSMRFGELLLIASILYFGLAWLGYLKRDGLKVASPGKNRAKRVGDAPGAGSEAASATGRDWTERIPGLGVPPSPTPSIPGPEGPESEAYRALLAAEDKLRARIRGETGEDPAISPASGAGEPAPLKPVSGVGKIPSIPLALAGILLLAAGVSLEYWIRF